MRKWIIALGTILLPIGSFFLYFGLRAYLFPRTRWLLYGGVAWAGLGSLLAIIGVSLILVGVSKHGIEATSKRKTIVLATLIWIGALCFSIINYLALCVFGFLISTLCALLIKETRHNKYYQTYLRELLR